MKDMKILAVLVTFILATYYGIEPLAHSQMHPHVAPADFEFKDIKEDYKGGDAANGKTLFASAGCVGCHSLNSQKMSAPMDNATMSASFGVVAPDLSSSGAIYTENFLGALIADPAKALHVAHKFSDTKPHPMPKFFGLGGDKTTEIKDIVAYLKSIAPKTLSDEQVYNDACARCHSVKYLKNYRPSDAQALQKYMGGDVPDLSMVIRSKGEHYLKTFINEPSKHLKGTAMPRVGLNEKAQKQVITYLEKAGDRKKNERESLGVKIIIYMLIFTTLAYLWYKKVWRDLH